MLGREVQTFVNERQSIGKHFAVLHVINLSSGVYFCRASAAFTTAPGHPERSEAESKDELGRPKGLREWPSPSTASQLYRDFAQCDGLLLVYLHVHTTHPRVILSAAERSRRMS